MEIILKYNLNGNYPVNMHAATACHSPRRQSKSVQLSK